MTSWLQLAHSCSALTAAIFWHLIPAAKNTSSVTYVELKIKVGRSFSRSCFFHSLLRVHIDTSSKVVVTTSKPSAFPSSLRTRLRSDLKEVSQSEMRTDSEINMTCEDCGSTKVRYYTQQLRSADEGTTVFYTCPECGKKWNTNN